ncbi:2-deoxy-D-gluconate 3-dehydrogenase [Rhodoferax koreense]|uniref:2-deoxy-D-gluconate 3-dehydrogenase n=1 Tax=Rhodoferax koreensis TaxID=1842727 RepID=A0A1P8JQP8_9BURK|nr:SDR family oxidoreductase [Rhodoferax koreense]APW36051.1 2-deoxy-D-gluconate 3-dehydrogenase [Rhodoferax koreense]
MSEHWLGLARKVCVVTGAASGIGAAVARGLADAGAAVALLDRDAAGCEALAAELRAADHTAIAVACDTSREDSVAAAAEKVQVELGDCHALVNNAGFLRAGTLDDVSLADWNAVLAVNLTGYLLCARAFAKPMRAAGQGSIVNVASISARFPQARSGAYSASKSGVLLLSRQIAVEWGPEGVRSNAICPGMIRTALSAKFYEEPGFEAKRAAVTASRRVGEPQDIADVALFLASPRSAYVNGAEVMVDGGMSSMLMDMVPRPGFNNS